jgi:hypothetical protein
MSPKASRKVSPRSGAILRLTDSARRGELVAVVGTGVSIALTDNKVPSLSWKGLILDGFAHAVQKGRISPAQQKSWRPQLQSNDLDDLLGAAEFMGRKLDAPVGDLYARWLENTFKDLKPTNKKMQDAIRTLQACSVPLCTLNYDSLLESVTGLPTVNLGELGRVAAWMRKESAGILHLHGSWDTPAMCILGIRDYSTTIGDEARDLIQRSLGSFRRLLFIGCGNTFADPNFSALVQWLRVTMKTAAPEHYALVKDPEMAARHADPNWQGFVEPLSYGPSNTDLPKFITKYFASTAPAISNPKVPSTRAGTTTQNARVVQDYRAFLIKDCGQMTIEGVRADMDTAQRRFDLERLFVPLSLLPPPPDIPETDPQREQKLIEWREKHKDPRPFGKVFAKRKRLALLALPGGGKTLLLKRLAVAYAQPTRRKASEDGLPDLDLIPVLIRCREWRDEIHRPIGTLLQNIPELTGQTSLSGLSEALIPLFKAGRVLLLVDGLDEIHDDALRSIFVENLESFLGDFKQTRLLVTSREAGFSLVAPTLARFCERWKVAPLDQGAILKLCSHWHRLMVGDTPEAQAEGDDVAQTLLRNDSLRRLAENPLLLTMLLVVKRGAGRLPPDRVSLYSRAVEVLLDTWNIKGHEPLNAKEAVPQLAFVAFQLMRSGKQTATETELLALLEEAREKVPQIRRYAKDTPQEFLRRVELRSSLLVEAGRQADSGGTVPFYQFRHLTFQEHLAAVAAVEGHYLGYQKEDTVLTPLAPYLTAEEWKEVIPMSAVLARKQAEPLIAELVTRGRALREMAERGEDFPGRMNWRTPPPKMPAPAARLAQCLAEEAEAAPETLTGALELVAYFARGCHSVDDWSALSRGPYGEDLLHQAWLLHRRLWGNSEAWTYSTLAGLASRRIVAGLKDFAAVQAELVRLLNSQSNEEVARGLAACAGLLMRPEQPNPATMSDTKALLIRQLFSDDAPTWVLAAWSWGIFRYKTIRKLSPEEIGLVLDQLLALFLRNEASGARVITGFALTRELALERDAWRPSLEEEGAQTLRELGSRPRSGEEADYIIGASLMIGFHVRSVWSENELASKLHTFRGSPFLGADSDKQIDTMLQQMGESGRKYLKSKVESRRSS